MSTDLEKRIATLEEFAADVREFTAALRALITRHDERHDERKQAFREANESIAALANAQLQSKQAAREAKESIAELANAQNQDGERVDAAHRARGQTDRGAGTARRGRARARGLTVRGRTPQCLRCCRRG